MANFAAFGLTYSDQSSWDQRVLDVLVPRPSFGNLEYIEYNRDLHGPPDYKFEIREMNALVQRDTELIGQRFLLRNSDEFAQVQARISFSDIQLALAVFVPSSEGLALQLPTTLVAVIKQSQPAEDIVLTCDIKNERYSGRFYTFCNFIYTERMKNQRDSLVIHLYAKKAWEDIFTQILRWKVDCSNTDLMDDLGLTSYFHADPFGFRVQIRLFLRGQRVAAQFRFFNELNEISRCKTNFSLKLILINPTDQRLNIVYPFDFHEWFKLEEWDEVEYFNDISTIREIVDVKQLSSFLVNNKLMAKVELNYFGNVPN